MRGFVVYSDAFPGLVTARAVGQAPHHPDLVGVTELNPRIAELRNVASGVFPGPGDFDFPVVMPAADPPPEDAARHLQAVRIDVEETCRLGWIDESRVCSSLEKRLAGAIDALQGGDASSVPDRLVSFLSELESDRDSHVYENAYWLLHLHVRDVLDAL